MKLRTAGFVIVAVLALAACGKPESTAPIDGTTSTLPPSTTTSTMATTTTVVTPGSSTSIPATRDNAAEYEPEY